MEAFENILRLYKASTIREMDDAVVAAHEAINELHLAKLKELESTVAHRLGAESRLANIGMSPMVGPVRDEGPSQDTPRQRRPVRDEPQA